MLPVRASATYLGITASYSNFELQSVTQRVKCAHLAFQRLSRWLLSRQIAFRFRLQLWRASVYATLIYGLQAVGWTAPGIQLAHKTIMTMYRKITRNYSFLTHHSHLYVLHHFSLEQPIDLLLRSAELLQHTTNLRRQFLSDHDILWMVDWSHLGEQMHLLRLHLALIWQAQLQRAPMTDTTQPEALYSCMVFMSM